MQHIKSFLLYIHQLPQHLIALLVILFNKKSVKKYYNYYSIKHCNNSAVSLGNYIFVDSDCYSNSIVIMHEQGHQKQSIYLGWLYLIIIGIPSALHNIWWRFHRDRDYYSFYTERWADKLSNIKR